MSGPYSEYDAPMVKRFKCDICGYETLTKMGMWQHLEKKHPELYQQEAEKAAQAMGNRRDEILARGNIIKGGGGA